MLLTQGNFDKPELKSKTKSIKQHEEKGIFIPFRLGDKLYNGNTGTGKLYDHSVAAKSKHSGRNLYAA